MNDRYVIALRSEFDFADPVLDLPDVEHIHLTRLPDGRWTAVAMEWTRIDAEDPSNTRWRDVPVEEAGA